MMKKLIAMVLTFVLVPMLFAGTALVRKVDGTQEFTNFSARKSELPYRSGGRQQVLFIQDASLVGPYVLPDQWWGAVLDSVIPGNYTMWGPTTTYEEDGPDLATMQGYDLVIWNTYDSWAAPTLTANDQSNLGDYITGGGKVWLIGQDVLYSGVPLAFIQTYFDLASYESDYPGGMGSDSGTFPLTPLAEIEGWDFSFTNDWGSDVFPDNLTPNANAHHVINDATYPANYPAILRNDSTTSFWTVDGRMPDPWDNWEMVVYIMFDVFGLFTGVAENDNVTAETFDFSATTISRGAVNIHFALPAATTVELFIYDALGRARETVISEKFSAGSHNVNTHLTLPSGVYFYKMDTGLGTTATEKLVLVD
jgi:hypothetical protein